MLAMAARERFDRLERMTNLVLVLLETTRPLTLREISGTVAGYPEGPEASRQAFERDKRALRELGVPLTIAPVESEQQVGYRILADDYYLPDLGLDADEEQALGFAIAAVQLGGGAGADAIAKLGGPVTEAALGRVGLHGDGDGVAGPGVAPVAVLPSLPALGLIHDALRRRAVVRFRYHDREREVEPFGLAFRAGAWYLVGRDRAAAGGAATRTFRVDRFESTPSASEPFAYEPPIGTNLRDEIRLLPWSATEAAAEVPVAELVVDARQARVVATQVPSAAIAAWTSDGSVCVRLPVGDLEAFVSWAVGLGDTLKVEGPPALRAAVVGRLRELATPLERPPTPPGSPPAALASAVATVQVRKSPSRGRTGGSPTRLANAVMAGERLRRLLAILVHLARVGEADLADVAERFSMGESELVHELELAACCGVPPYTPDALIELFVDGDKVVAQRLREFGRPQRLTPDEGFVLAAAARALLSVPGADDEGVLRSALGKLEASLGSAPLAVEIDQPEHLQAVREAAQARARLEITYFSSSATAPGRRRVDPYQVVLREGQWYADCWCHTANGLRRFQIDRIQSVQPTGESFARPDDLPDELRRPGAFLGGADALAARVAFPAASELAVEQVAAGAIEPMDDGSGRLAATILVGDAEGWFGRLLLRLGPGTEVLSPVELRHAGVNAALRGLRAYGEPEGTADPEPARPAGPSQSDGTAS
jgi:predicted DNA-binding transcriptional regulator YafY